PGACRSPLPGTTARMRVRSRERRAPIARSSRPSSPRTMHDAADVALYAVVAAASPTVLVAALVVLGSGRGRVNGLVFTAAFVLGQSVAYLVSFLVGAASTPDDGGSCDLVDVLELVVGILLLGVAWRRRSGRSEQLS